MTFVHCSKCISNVLSRVSVLHVIIIIIITQAFKDDVQYCLYIFCILGSILYYIYSHDSLYIFSLFYLESFYVSPRFGFLYLFRPRKKCTCVSANILQKKKQGQVHEGRRNFFYLQDTIVQDTIRFSTVFVLKKIGNKNL